MRASAPVPPADPYLAWHMASRTFIAPDGTLWQAWDVIPGAQAEWPVNARRHLPDSLVAGWLCFECEREKRRLTPIPPAWETGSDGEFWGFCESATPVRHRPTLPPGPLA